MKDGFFSVFVSICAAIGALFNFLWKFVDGFLRMLPFFLIGYMSVDKKHSRRRR